MKTDRLYALTLYLLNHRKSSASELAKHFEVSVRTIQRDIDCKRVCFGYMYKTNNLQRMRYEINVEH